MKMKQINAKDFYVNGFNLFNNWLLLTSGDFSKKSYNNMIISWGKSGIMWGKNIVDIVVRPSRYTYEFIEKENTFTLCSFGEEHKSKIAILGSKSGREIDKMNMEGLTPIPSTYVAAPSYQEADFVLECKVIYKQDLDVQQIQNSPMETSYNGSDYHRQYTAEIVAIYI